MRLALFQSYAIPSGHNPSLTVSTPNRPHTSKSGPLIVTNVPTILANAIAWSSVGHEFNGSPFLLIILYIARLYYFLNYWSTGTPTLIRTERFPPFERDDFTNLSMGACVVDVSGIEPLTLTMSRWCTTAVLNIQFGAPEETRTPKIWFLRPTRIPIPSPGH